MDTRSKQRVREEKSTGKEIAMFLSVMCPVCNKPMECVLGEVGIMRCSNTCCGNHKKKQPIPAKLREVHDNPFAGQLIRAD